MSKILLAHGSGSRKTAELIDGVFHKYLNDPVLMRMDDSAVLGDIVFTTDTFVVSPLFFPGGDIGRLAVSGTVNDVSVMGARPEYMSVGFIIEEGFLLEDLEKILKSIREAADEAGVRIVTGDTKVVEKGKGDGIYINTSGIGENVFSPTPSIERIEPGNVVILNGAIGLHEIAVLVARGEFGLEVNVESDVAPLWGLIEKLNQYDIRFMRDPTRGGMAQTLNEIVKDRDFGIQIDETALPLTPEVSSVCEILGFDPLHLANEGKVIIIAGENDVNNILETLRAHPLGSGAGVIGRVTGDKKGLVSLKTRALAERVVMPPSGELLPRIC